MSLEPTIHAPGNPRKAASLCAGAFDPSLQALSRMLHAAVYTWDPGKDELRQSSLHREWFGSAPSGSAGRWLVSRCAAADRSRLIRAQSEVLAGRSGSWQLCYTARMGDREVRVTDRAEDLGAPSHRILGVVEPLGPLEYFPESDGTEAPTRGARYRRIIEGLSRSERHYRLLTENATDLITVLDCRGRFRYLSPSAFSLLGYEPEELLGRNALDLVHAADLAHARDALERMRRTAQPVSTEVRLRGKNGQYLWIDSSGRPLPHPAGRVEEIMAICRDVTADRKARRLSRLDRNLAVGLSSDTTLQAAMDRVMDTLDLIEEVQAAALYLRRDSDDSFAMLAQRGVGEDLIQKRLRFSARDPLLGPCLAGKAQYGQYMQLITEPRKEDRNASLRAAAVIPIPFDGRVIASIKVASRLVDDFPQPVRDALESIASHLGATIVRIRAEEKVKTRTEQLRSLASQLAMAEEEQRRRIARGLHDRLGQTLAAMKISTGLLQRSIVDAKTRGQAEDLRRMLDGAMKEIRTLTFELCPPVLYEMGLGAAISWLIEQIGQTSQLEVGFQEEGPTPTLSEDKLGLIFQVVRELLANVSRHAQASGAIVKLETTASFLKVTVADDGKGFDMEKVRAAGTERGFGLFSIRERLDQLQGHMEIDTQPGAGTKILIHMPIGED
jgi:PAS domain S-box-containing protein